MLKSGGFAESWARVRQSRGLHARRFDPCLTRGWVLAADPRARHHSRRESHPLLDCIPGRIALLAISELQVVL